MQQAYIFSAYGQEGLTMVMQRAYIHPIKNIINPAIEIVSAALLSSVVGAAIGAVANAP
jgi:hypothetical protein